MQSGDGSLFVIYNNGLNLSSVALAPPAAAGAVDVTAGAFSTN